MLYKKKERKYAVLGVILSDAIFSVDMCNIYSLFTICQTMALYIVNLRSWKPYNWWERSSLHCSCVFVWYGILVVEQSVHVDVIRYVDMFLGWSLYTCVLGLRFQSFKLCKISFVADNRLILMLNVIDNVKMHQDT